MSINLEELDYANTSIGELILRRRRFPMPGDTDVFEVILNEEFLMSSLYTAGEIALANLGLDVPADGAPDVIVAGLGLGSTAPAPPARGSTGSACRTRTCPSCATSQARAGAPRRTS